MAGTLFVVATPIGNLDDLTFRALSTLREVDVIAAEDTRRTAKLLARYEVRKPMISLREHNETRQIPSVLGRLASGESVALVSDAGTPGIADPGARLVRAALEAGIAVRPIPGPSALTAALSASGLPADQFVFLGFPPASGRARDDWFDGLSLETRTAAFLEAPHRIRRTLRELLVKGKQPIYVFREITKIHEQLVICNSNDDVDAMNEKGEFTVVVPASDVSAVIATDSTIYALFLKLVDGAGLVEDMTLDLVGHAFKVGPRRVSNIVKKMRILVKQQNKET